MYTTLDLFEISSHIESTTVPDYLDLESVLANLYGRTYFEMLRKKPEFLKNISENSELHDDNLKFTKNENNHS